MKRFFILLAVTIIALFLAYVGLRTFTKSKSPEAQAEYNRQGTHITVLYCQPAKRNRVIFGRLVPYGQVWRTGANEATIIVLGENMTVGGQPIKAGTYSLWTIPSPNGWTVIFNSETGHWGTNYDPKRDVLRIPVKTRPHSPPLELFTISFTQQTNGADMLLTWDETQAVVPFRN